MKKQTIFGLLSLLSIASSSVAFASTQPWPTSPPNAATAVTPYYYYFQSQDTLRTSLIKIAQTFDVKVYFSDDLSDDTLNQPIEGNFKVFSPIELYNKFASKFNFTWFYYSGILYICSNNYTIKNLNVAPEVLPNFKDVIDTDGLVDPKFGWTEIPAQGTVVVSGPKEYVNLLSKRMLKLNISPVNQEFAVFRLKYASAVDTQVDVSNGQIVIPGVVTILKTMLQGSKNVPSGVDSKLLQQVIEPIKNNFKNVLPQLSSGAAESTNTANASSDAASNLTSDNTNSTSGPNRASITSPVIEADNRLNTIVIRDKSANIPIYKALIEMLDVPAPLIQVEVLIVDVDQVKMNNAGVSWWGNSGGEGNAANSVSGGFGSNNLANQTTSGGAPSLIASFGNVSPGNLIVNNLTSFIAGLRFLEGKGYAKAQSRSAVITIDNIAAIVNLTESYYAAQTQSQQNNQVQTQMQMQVIPHLITEDENKRRIKLIVALKDGNVEERVVNGMPATLQGVLNSQAVIDEGSSLLLAGFTHKQTEQVESKVPILGDIPLLGWLFKNKSASSRSLQRSYLVTPKIIWSDKHEKIPNYSILSPKP